MEMPRFRVADLLLLLTVLAVAAGARAGYLVLCADNAQKTGPLLVQGEDAPERERLATSVKERGQFISVAPLSGGKEEDTAHTAPGYPYLVGMVARLPAERDVILRWTQCGLGALTAGLYFLFARRAFRSEFIGLLTGLLCALHPFWIVNTAELADGVLASFLVAACLFLGARASQSGGAFTSLLYGLALAGSALVRATLLPFAFVGLLWFLLRCRQQTRGWLLALLAFMGFGNGLTVWTLRNVQRVQEVVPIVDSTYLHLWIGNSPKATGGPLDEDALLQALAEQRGVGKEELAGQLAELPQKQRYASLGGAVVAEVAAHPTETLQRRIWAGLYFIFGEAWFRDQRLWQTESTAEAGELPSWLAGSYPAIFTGALLGMLLLSGLGWRWSYGWRWESMPAALALIWVPLPYLLSHAETLQGPRLPLDGVLLCYAAFAVTCLLPGIGSYQWAGSDRRV
jgi:hypothetical protein